MSEPLACAMSHDRHLVYVDDATVEVLVVQPARAACSRTLVFFHGWGLSPRSYLGLLEACAERGLRVIAPALPGFGRSAALADPRRDTFSRIVERVAGALDAEGLDGEPVALAGHSLGAGVAVRLACQRPDQAQSVSLLCPIGGGGPGVATWARLAAGLRHEVGRHPLSRVADAVPSFLAHPAGSLATGVAAKHADLTGDLAGLAGRGMPVLVVAADRDGIVSTERVRAVRGLTVVPVEGTHGWPLAFPDACADLVAEFTERAVGGADATCE